MQTFDISQQEVEQAFKILENILNKNPLPDNQNQPRFACPDEFMLMSIVKVNDKIIQYDFKHRDSRNYLILKMFAWAKINEITITEWKHEFKKDAYFNYYDLSKFDLN